MRHFTFLTLPLLTMPLIALAACQAKQPAAKPDGDAERAGAPAAGAPPMQGDPAKNPDMTGFAREVDSNADGRMSSAEWQAKALPESSFQMFEKGRGYVTLDDYRTNAAPPGIDLDGDGKLTVAEFRAFDRQMAAKMPAGGKAPPRP